MRKYPLLTLLVVLVVLLMMWPLYASARTLSNPQYQFGEIHSCTTRGTQTDQTSDGGEEWMDNAGPPAGHPAFQVGVVHSFTTGGKNANVTTGDGGLTWYFKNVSPLFCSAP